MAQNDAVTKNEECCYKVKNGIVTANILIVSALKAKKRMLQCYKKKRPLTLGLFVLANGKMAASGKVSSD